MEMLKAGDKVFLFPVKIRGEVIELRQGGSDSAEEGKQLYKVKFPEQTLMVRRENLNALDKPSGELVRDSLEWNEENLRFQKIVEEFSKGGYVSQGLFGAMIESGARLGWVVPIE
jgi:hypothetical protein